LVDDPNFGKEAKDFVRIATAFAHTVPIFASIGQRGLTATWGPYPIRANI
jgi:hypothetical protein